MTLMQRQLWWLGLFAALLGATAAMVFWVPYRTSLFYAVVPLVLTYGWVRFVITIWKPLYRQDVSPGWSVTLFFAGFGVFFLFGIVYRVAIGYIE